MMNSKIVSFFASLFSKLGLFYEESLCAKIFNKILFALGKAFNGSVIHKFFSIEGLADVWQESIFGKILSIPSKIFYFLKRKISPWLSEQIENSVLCNSFSKWNHISVRIYGLAILMFGSATALFRENSKMTLVLLIFAEIIGFILILINRSINQIVSGSRIAIFAGNIFTDCNFKDCDVVKSKKSNYVIAGLVGLVMSAVCIYGGVVELILIVGVVCAFAFLMKYLSLGVFLTIALSPILPTMVLVGLSFICTFVFLFRAFIDEDFKFAKNSLNGAVVFFVISLLWGVVNSYALTASLKQVLVHGSFIVFYVVVVNVITTKRQWLALMKVFAVSALIVALYGIAQNYLDVSSTESWIDEKMFENIGKRVYSFFNNPNVLGEFLVLTIPICIALVWNKVRKSHRVFFAIISVSAIMCMVFTWSRGAWLGLILAMAIFLVISDRRWILAGVMAVLLLPVLLYATGNTAIIERFMSIGNTADTSTAYRVSIWKASVGIIGDFWFRGIGIGSDAYQKIYPAYALPGAEFALHSHNLYLQYIVETSVIGFASLLGIILGYVKNVFSSGVVTQIKKSDIAKIVVALGAGFVGFLFQGLTDYVWYNYKMLMIFWIIIALGVSGVSILKKEKEGGDSL